MVRVMLSLVSICLGFDEIEGSTMVTFLHESRRTIRQIMVEGKRNKHRSSTIDHAKQSILSFLFNLRVFVSQTPTNATINVHNNKTSVIVNIVHELLVQCYMHEWANGLTVFFYFFVFQQLNASVTFSEKDDRITTNSEDSDLEDQIYNDFLTRPIETSDSDDEDFVYELNGDDVSDTDSQSSVATEDLTDDDATDDEATNEVSQYKMDKVISRM